MSNAHELQETHATVMMVARMLLALDPEQLSALLDEYARTDALMPIMDPTRYKAIMGNIGGHRAVTQAIARCRAEIARVTGDEVTP